jgi:cytochrome c peroxidase
VSEIENGEAAMAGTMTRVKPRSKWTALAAIGAAAGLGVAFATLWDAGGAHSPSRKAAPSATTAPPSATTAPPSAFIDPERLASFSALPPAATSPSNPLTDEKINLGRMLFYEPRLSKNHDISCNSCHPLDKHGADGEKLSLGHAHQFGKRNTPGVYNASGYFALFWDGRAANVEEQAKMPILNPAEMGMTEQRVEATLRSIPTYTEAFARAFPSERSPVTFHNATRAIAAFERRLLARGRWDRFIEGDASALTDAEKVGFNAFVDVGCVTCHYGPYVGATSFQKVGLVKAWPNTKDRGRYEVTQQDVDYMVFRVPSLRNVALTGPYFHDGSVSSLEEAIRMMARHQLGTELSPERVTAIATWLASLTGETPTAYIKKPALPPSGPTTPRPEPE